MAEDGDPRNKKDWTWLDEWFERRKARKTRAIKLFQKNRHEPFVDNKRLLIPEKITGIVLLFLFILFTKYCK